MILMESTKKNGEQLRVVFFSHLRQTGFYACKRNVFIDFIIYFLFLHCICSVYIYISIRLSV